MEMTRQQVQKELDKLVKEETKWRSKAFQAAKPFVKVAHKYHLKWEKLYKKYIRLENK